MCSQPTATALVSSYGIKMPNPATGSPFVFHPSMTQAAFDFHRAQIYDYNARLHYGLRAYPGAAGAISPYHPHAHDPLAHFYQSKFDPRARFVHEEPKPSHSYIGLIAMAILDSKEGKMVLADIYQWILDNYSYFRNRGPGWRNSIRHNLSLNDCFIKAGRSANGKGHYWAIHPANIDDFKKGDFRRRKAQRKVRRHMGLSVPDDEDSPSPPPPSAAPDSADWASKVLGQQQREDSAPLSPGSATSPNSLASPSSDVIGSNTSAMSNRSLPEAALSPSSVSCGPSQGHATPTSSVTSGANSDASPQGHAHTSGISGKKRLFDVESLLAPEMPVSSARFPNPLHHLQAHHHLPHHHHPHHHHHTFDLSLHHPAKIQKTSLGMTSPDMNSARLPRLALEEINVENKRDQDLDDDENIDVEETEDDEDVSKNCDNNGNNKVHNYSIISSHSSIRDDTSPERAKSPRSGSPPSRPLSPANSASSPTPRSAESDSSLSARQADNASNHYKMDAELVTIEKRSESDQKESFRKLQGPLGLHSRVWAAGPAGWREPGHASAFHSTGANSAVATSPIATTPAASGWTGGLPPHGFPLLPLSGAVSSPAEALAAQQRWQETFTRMMASQRQMESKHDVKSEA